MLGSVDCNCCGQCETVCIRPLNGTSYSTIKDDELSKANYRPVTVLPAINNIFKSILAAQLNDFYSSMLSDFISS